MEYKLIGVDIAKRVFQVCCVDASGEEVLTKRLSRERFLLFLRPWRRRRSRLRPALVRITGAGR